MRTAYHFGEATNMIAAEEVHNFMKVAAYARYSTDKQTENSIAAQLDCIIKYCQANKHEIVSTYIDEATTGTNTEREGFINLVQGAREHQFECVVIYDISRGSRDVGDWFHFRREMQRLNIQVISATERLGDISNPNDFLVELINVGLGQHMVLQTRQKSIAGVAERAKQGLFLGGTPPLGYDIVNGEYVVNESEANTVRTIFELYADGRSYNEILSAIQGAIGKRGRPLGKNSLFSILNNERYIGVYTWNKRYMKMMNKWAGGKPNPNCVRIENCIEPIIDKETWGRVQARMRDNKRKAVNKAKRSYLLSGLIECTECGSTFVGHTSRNSKGYETRYYLCGNKYRTHTCNAKAINADELETFVIQHLKNYLLKTDFQATANYIAEQVNNASPDLSREKKELSEIESKIANGMRYILAGKEFPELETEILRLRVRKSELEDIIAINQRRNKRINPASIVKLFQESIEKWGDDNLQNIIKYHITKIYAHVDGSFTVNIGVHLTGCGRRI